MARLPKYFTKRNGSYGVRVRHKGKIVTRQFGPDFAEAKRRGFQFLAELRQERPAVAETLTFGKMAERWLMDHAQGSRVPKGYVTTRRRLENHVLPLLGNCPLDAGLTDNIFKLKRDLCVLGLAPPTILSILSDVRATLNYAVTVREIPTTPFPKKLMPTLPELAPKWLTGAQVKVLLLAAPVEFGWAIELSVLTGIRWGELLRLRQENVQWKPHPHLVIEKAKNRKLRRVPLVPRAAEIMRERTGNDRVGLVAGFPFQHAAHIRCRVKVPFAWNWKGLRNTFAYRYLMVGGDLVALQKTMGHSDIKLTLQYAALLDDYSFRDAGKIGRGLADFEAGAELPDMCEAKCEAAESA